MAAPKKKLVLEISPAVEKRLTAVASARAESWEQVAEEALNGYLDRYDQEVKAIQQGLREAGDGRLIDHEKVAGWLESWGKGRPSPPPRCD